MGKREQQASLQNIVFLCVLSRETFCFPEGSDWRRQMVYRFGGKGLEKAWGDVGEEGAESQQAG